MKTVYRELIEYKGISQCIPLEIDNFAQIVVDKELCIPDDKPNIEEVLKVYVESEIINSRIVKTPKGTSLEGVKLTGYKLMLEGKVKIRVQYIADIREQSVHSVQFAIPFIAGIVLPENFTLMSIVTTTAFVEDIFVQKLNSRRMYENVSLLLIAEIC